jgi:hypothetical protein
MTIDVDATWNGEGSLDAHREAELKKIQQPGFGAHAKPPVKPEPEVVSDQTDKPEEQDSVE